MILDFKEHFLLKEGVNTPYKSQMTGSKKSKKFMIIVYVKNYLQE